ncbi:hypothetical protein [Mesorhizobium sp. CAU 1741]|uniref:hypothetical protein n=1 Tax=Mesorhizobium sp. CAU 1741 TaxID=3140366 RepID=UPI00325A5DBB
MNEFDKARPVSGEIMTDAPSPRENVRKEGFADAEFETVEPARDAQPRRTAEVPAPTGMEFLKQGEAEIAGKGRQPGGPLFWMTGLVLVVLAFWVSGGHAFVRQSVLPPPSQPQRQLHIADVSSRIERLDGRDVLFVEGQARNDSQTDRDLPAIEIVVFANDGTETRYFLGTSDAPLGPGERYAFSSRLEAPRNGVKTVSVTFQEDNR